LSSSGGKQKSVDNEKTETDIKKGDCKLKERFLLRKRDFEGVKASRTCAARGGDARLLGRGRENRGIRLKPSNIWGGSRGLGMFPEGGDTVENPNGKINKSLGEKVGKHSGHSEKWYSARKVATANNLKEAEGSVQGSVNNGSSQASS